MKLQIISDLHLEFHRDKGKEFLKSLKNAGAEVLTIAGDLAPVYLNRFAETFKYFSDNWEDVVFVAGNHEFYAKKADTVIPQIQEKLSKFSNVFVLNNEYVTLNKTVIYGGTGWFPEPVSAIEINAKLFMNDFQEIRKFEPWVYEQHTAFIRRLASDADVVISHHLPDSRCVTPRFKTSALNAFFVGNFPLEEISPKLWICGHTHDSVDLQINQTRVVANPFGYIHDLNPNFQPHLVIDV